MAPPLPPLFRDFMGGAKSPGRGSPAPLRDLGVLGRFGGSQRGFGEGILVSWGEGFGISGGRFGGSWVVLGFQGEFGGSGGFGDPQEPPSRTPVTLRVDPNGFFLYWTGPSTVRPQRDPKIIPK